MKKNIAFVLALVAFALIGCEKNTPWEPGDPAKTKQVISFPVPGELGVELDPEAMPTSHDFVIERKDTKGALTVKLNVLENTDKAFDVPNTVAFEDGKAQATITAKFNKMVAGNTYKLKVQADFDATNPYALEYAADSSLLVPVYEYEATVVKWEPGVGVFVDNPVLALLGLPAGIAWTADYKYTTQPDGTIRFVILNPYTTPATAQDESGVYIGCPFTDVGGLELDQSKDYNMNLWIDEDGVTVEDYDLGLIFTGYGMLAIKNYKGNASFGVFDNEINAIVFDQEDLDNNSVLYAGATAVNYVGFWFYLSLEDYLKDNAEPAAIHERLVAKTIFGAQPSR